MKNRLILGFLILGLGYAQGQATVGYYPFNSVLSIATNTQKSVWLDTRIQSNSILSSLNIEFAPMFAVKKNPNSVYYAGLGVNTSIIGEILGEEKLLKGYFLSTGVRVQPFEKYRQVGLAFEVSPYSAANFKSGVFRTWLGITYRFGNK